MATYYSIESLSVPFSYFDIRKKLLSFYTFYSMSRLDENMEERWGCISVGSQYQIGNITWLILSGSFSSWI